MIRRALVLSLGCVAASAAACPSGTAALFGCDAEKRKFIELCAPSPIDEVIYRFGSVDANGDDAKIELEHRREPRRFFGATYTKDGVYTQSVRFTSGNYDYTVYTEARGMQSIDAGVRVRDRASGKTTTVGCTERPRFYIYELKGLVSCDPETPAGNACIK
jgi:hypothetical protein